MTNLYKFSLDCGSMGALTGVFIAEPEQIEKIMGKEIYFGEVLGKHSEISAEMEPDMFKILTDNKQFISDFHDYGCSCGINPLHYIDD